MPCASRMKRGFAGRCLVKNRRTEDLVCGCRCTRPGKPVLAGAVCANQVYRGARGAGGRWCAAVVLISQVCLSTPKNYRVSFEIKC